MTFIYFVLVLSVIIFIHELGHFIFAKRFKVHVFEFALGMGPRIFSFKRKNDETIYAIRLIPIGGFVQIAGEGGEADAEIADANKIQSKGWLNRFVIIVAGAAFNFLLSLLLLFIIGLSAGSLETKPLIGKVTKDFPAYQQGVEEGDLILAIEGKKMRSWDQVLLFLELNNDSKPLTFTLQKKNNHLTKVTITPIQIEEDGQLKYKYGIGITDKINYGLLASLKFMVVKFITIINSMFEVIYHLIVGNLGLNNLAGPVGIYNIIGEETSHGFINVLYLISFLSINVGFINLIPFPAFDGGRLLFLIIEKIKGKPVNSKVENVIHAIGFSLLIILLLVITIQDIKNLF